MLQETAADRWWHNPRWMALACALAGLLIHLPSLGFDFVYDDVSIVLNDARLDDPAFIGRIWKAPWWPEGSAAPASRPVTTFTFWLQTQLGGKSPPAFHAANILLYAGVCGLVGLLTSQLLRKVWCGWVAGLIFAAHPIHVEAAANIVGRAETLAALFALAAICLWLRWRGSLCWSRSAAIGLLVLLAGLSKEHGYLAGPIILLMEWALRRSDMASPSIKPATARKSSSKPAPGENSTCEIPPACGGGRAAIIKMFVMLTLVALLAGGQRIAMSQQATIKAGEVSELDNPLWESTTSERIATPYMLVGKAVGLAIMAEKQSPDYSPRMLMPTSNWADGRVMLGVFVVGLWIAGVFMALRFRLPALGALVAIPIAWFIPSNTFMLIGTIFGERLLTFVSIFVVIGIVGLAAAIPWKRQAAMHAGIIVGLMTIWMALETIAYSQAAWSSQDAQLGFMVENHPRSGRFAGFAAIDLIEKARDNQKTLTGLDLEKFEQEFWDEAEKMANLALENWPQQARPYHVLGEVAWMRATKAREIGRLEEYQQLARQARRYSELARRNSSDPKMGARVLGLLGDILDPQQAKQDVERLESELASKPGDIGLQKSLARALTQAGMKEKALEILARLHKTFPADDALTREYLDLLIGLGRMGPAVEVYKGWIARSPGSWSLLFDGAAVAMAGNLELPLAKAWLEKATQMSPGSPEPWAGLGQWHEMHGEAALAGRFYLKALQVSPPQDPNRGHYQLMLDKLRRKGGV